MKLTLVDRSSSGSCVGEFDSQAAARILVKDERRRQRAESATKSEGSSRRPWGTVPKRMDDQLRAALLAQMREVSGELYRIGDQIRESKESDAARAKHAEEALLDLVVAYEEAINIAADWQLVAD